MTTCAIAWAAALPLPVIVLLWATESRSTRTNALRRLTPKQVAKRYGVSQSSVRRWSVVTDRLHTLYLIQAGQRGSHTFSAPGKASDLLAQPPPGSFYDQLQLFTSKRWNLLATNFFQLLKHVGLR